MSTVTYDITRLHVRCTYAISNTSQSTGTVWKRYTECSIYSLNKSGTIRSVGQAFSTPSVWISNKLTCIIYNRISGSSARCAVLLTAGA